MNGQRMKRRDNCHSALPSSLISSRRNQRRIIDGNLHGWLSGKTIARRPKRCLPLRLRAIPVHLHTKTPLRTANAHASLLNKLDAFQTMLQKAQGDAGDILQMVQWQRNLYATQARLIRFKHAKRVVEESDEFLKAYGKPSSHGDNYSQMIRELLHDFRDTAKVLKGEEKRLDRTIDQMKRHLGSLDQLERAHREFLLELQRQLL